ncbi:4Fe-4S dicluster domain-containing protein [Thermococcus sp. LS2]|uniref:4Fe-4S dicluster domain-containing protein n=1 Tax=Thermococcus sp. LS2 TaxID=1638260 RepID=UPI0014391241|nr:4Fe-4S dicluster domain-containing protein [Thermococcus sp. LS2]NJE13167.1 4Fe-4S dicluster domain-containing protein [Thermococcus sp. LS2]
MKSLVVVPDRCTGCYRCELICSFVHFKTISPAKSAIRVVRKDHAPVDVPIFCIQCGLCIGVCPVNALSRDPKTQAVVVDKEKCIGCGRCVYVCPYGAVTLDPETRKAVKCDLCGGDPQCVKICPENAIQYVDVNKASHFKRVAFANLWRKEITPLVPYPRRG